MLLYTPVSIGHGINCRGRLCVSPTICLYQANSSSSASSSLAKLYIDRFSSLSNTGEKVKEQTSDVHLFAITSITIIPHQTD